MLIYLLINSKPLHLKHNNFVLLINHLISGHQVTLVDLQPTQDKEDEPADDPPGAHHLPRRRGGDPPRRHDGGQGHHVRLRPPPGSPGQDRQPVFFLFVLSKFVVKN